MARFPGISIGVHVNPIAGSPTLPSGRVLSLLGPDGLFRGAGFASAWRRGLIRPVELEAELDEQIRRVQRVAGARLTHLDSHQNSHLSYLDLFLRLARRWKIPCMRTNASRICLEAVHPSWARARAYLGHPHVLAAHAYRRFQMRRSAKAGLRMADRLVTVGYAGSGNKSRLENWERILRNLPEGTSEIYCHPAYPDAVLRRWASYVEPRLQELEILRRPHLREVARLSGVRLISFFELSEA